MTIHHATIKSAASKGVVLTQDGDDVTAHRPEPNRRVTFTIEDFEGDEPTISEVTEKAKDAWVALDEILAYEAEHPTVRIEFEDGDYVGYLTSGDRDEIARDPDLADLFESLEEAAAEAAGDEEDEEEAGGSVVPPKYKALYAERGDATNCGDWLATTLNLLCRVTEDGKEVTDLDRLETIANANDVAPERYGKLGVVTNGWQGRFRMTVRNMLTPRVADKGFLFIPDGCGAAEGEMPAPASWCAEHMSKKAREAKAKAAGVQSQPGTGKESAKTQAKKGGSKAERKANEEAGLAAANAAIKSAKAKGRA
jgi:hypothetical protein